MKHGRELALLISLFLFIGFNLDGKTRESGSATCISPGGLLSVFFDTPQGKIRVNLPDDMAAGDIISGTLITMPAGRNDKARAKNLKLLKSYVLEIDGQKTMAGEDWGKWKIPHKKELHMTLKNKKDQVLGKTRLPVLPEQPTPESGEFKLPRMGQAGISLPVKGKFNGDFSNTDCRIGDKKVKIWAESPRQAVVASPMDQFGPLEIHLKEGDYETAGEYRNIGIALTAPKLKLKSGETTTLTVTARGLEGVDEEIPLSLENKTVDVVKMEGGQAAVVLIRPEDVSTDGIYTHRCTIVGIMPGNFNISALIEVPEDIEPFLIAYLSYEKEMLFVHEKYVEDAAKSLNAHILGPTKWQIPRAAAGFIAVTPSFVSDFIFLADLEPMPGDMKIYKSSICGLTEIGSLGSDVSCVKSNEEGIWQKVFTNTYKKCTRLEDSESACLETYTKVGYKALFSDEKCTRLIKTVDIYEFACAVPGKNK